MKLRGIQVGETVCRLLYRSRRAEVTWETLAIVGLILSRVWHVGRDVDQSDNRRIRSRFGNDGAAITVSHKNAWSILQSEDLGLNDDEVAFYDALAQNNSAVEAMGKDELKVIAAELVTQVRKSVTIDWTLRESARAKIKVLVKRILRKHGSPPDLEAEATQTVLAQAELPCAEWAET